MQIKEKFLFGDITDKIIAASYKVYNELGYGHPEKVYQNSLAVELEKIGLKYRRESYSKILYDKTIVGRYFLDFLVEDKTAVEIKVRRELYKSDWLQLISYLKSNKIKVGLLIVFAKENLKIKRVVNNA